MKKTTVNGMNEYLPKEVELREYLQNTILASYQSAGFQRISTPILEDIENLNKSEGGDNLNLIFKVLKRGEKLSNSLKQGEFDELADLGLRYDLTLPLSRYYANNRDKLMEPFKCIQMDRVYRAERPQKGRLREFVQCDIDILGTTSINAEIELIATTAKALRAINIGDFTVKINSRYVLQRVLLAIGFCKEELDSVCITFDKMDKIGLGGITLELDKKGFNTEVIQRFNNLLSKLPLSFDELNELCRDDSLTNNLSQIISSSQVIAEGRYEVVFDLTLVRGQGYYTDTVFEIESKQFRGAIAGGGRYDNLIGKFLDTTVPAVGFSIGFERIFDILTESHFQIPSKRKRLALIFEPNDMIMAWKKANELQAEYDVVLYEKPKKLGKFIAKIKEQGCDLLLLFGKSEVIEEL